MSVRSNARPGFFRTTSMSLVWFCCFFASLFPALALAEPGREVVSGVNHGGSGFAIADFDGDQLPDLAVVQVESYSSPKSKYSIRLQFSGGSGSAIGIEAPLGGLRIDSRDVNGDDRDDLIVSTALESEIVAILVSDGHGNFVMAKPELFPDLAEKHDSFLRDSGWPSGGDRTLLQSRSTFGEEVGASVDLHDGIGSDFCLKAGRSGAILRPIHSNLGRSPPAAAFA